MEYKGMNLCDFCFSQKNSENVCTNCGITHDTYNVEAGLLPPGTNILGKYIIGRVLGRGGFGATYLAYSSALDKPVAIKEYMPVSITYRGKGEENVTIVSGDKQKTFEKGAKRLFEEARTIAHFNQNPNIVSVYEFFNANDTVYYAMEYLEGCDLKKYIAKKGGKLSENEVIEITKAVCNALIIVHSTQTLHRDISPDNIFMCSNGDIKLIDFGAAKQVVSNADKSYSVVVKQGFAPSEQYSDKGNQGVWTDIYALGATMFYALMGKVPPNAIDRVENPELEIDGTLKYYNEFYNIINKCMQPKATDRYQSVIELMADLKNINIAEEIGKVKPVEAVKVEEKEEEEDLTVPKQQDFTSSQPENNSNSETEKSEETKKEENTEKNEQGNKNPVQEINKNKEKTESTGSNEIKSFGEQNNKLNPAQKPIDQPNFRSLDAFDDELKELSKKDPSILGTAYNSNSAYAKQHSKENVVIAIISVFVFLVIVGVAVGLLKDKTIVAADVWIDDPVVGEKVADFDGVRPVNSEEYTVVLESCKRYDGPSNYVEMSPTDEFEFETRYIIRYKIIPNEGYILDESTDYHANGLYTNEVDVSTKDVSYREVEIESFDPYKKSIYTTGTFSDEKIKLNGYDVKYFKFTTSAEKCLSFVTKFEIDEVDYGSFNRNFNIYIRKSDGKFYKVNTFYYTYDSKKVDNLVEIETVLDEPTTIDAIAVVPSSQATMSGKYSLGIGKIVVEK